MPRAPLTGDGHDRRRNSEDDHRGGVQVRSGAEAKDPDGQDGPGLGADRLQRDRVHGLE
jgi:hypothetical protein